MRDVFVIDNSIFDDALTDDSRSDLVESSKQLINEFFKLKLEGSTVAYIPQMAYVKFQKYFNNLGKTKTIALIGNIIEVSSSAKVYNKLDDAILDLAYKLTLTPCKVILVTNNQNMYKKLLSSDRNFYIANSKEALSIINHPNFIKKDTDFKQRN